MKHAISIARFPIGIVGDICSFGLFLSPMPTIIGMIKNKSVQEFQPYPYLLTSLNCIFWILYGLPFVHPHSPLVLIINAIGLGLELFYLGVYLAFADKSKRVEALKIAAVEMVAVAAVALVTFLVFHTHNSRSMFVGIVCVIFGISMYGSPLLIMKKVLQTKSVEFMPFYLSLASFINGLLWTTYAFLPLDLYILISNGTGAVLGAAQLAVYGWYRSYGVDGKAEKPSEVQLQNRTLA